MPTKNDLMEELDNLGIEYDATAKKSELVELLESYKAIPVESAEEEVVETESEAEKAGVVEEQTPAATSGLFTMVLNVKHDGKNYVSGNEYDLSAQNEALFRQRGWIA